MGNTREQWLDSAAAAIRHTFNDVFESHFGEKGGAHLDNLKVSTGFPSRGGLTKVIGECWTAGSAADEATHHIFINPRLTEPVEVLATLAHEMVHAADDGEHKHRGKFVRAVRELGLEGKPTATVAGEAFTEWAKGTAAALGDYPHIGLTPTAATKKQSTRMLKVVAPCCGYVVRTTKVWIETGLPSCPCGNEMELA